MDYQQATAHFFNELKDVEKVKELASYYSKPVDDVVARMKPYITVKTSKSGNVVSIKLQMMETGSKMYVEHYINFLTLRSIN